MACYEEEKETDNPLICIFPLSSQKRSCSIGSEGRLNLQACFNESGKLYCTSHK